MRIPSLDRERNLTKSFFGKNTDNRLWAQIVKRGTKGIHQFVDNMFLGMPATADRTGIKVGCWTRNPIVLASRTRQADTNRIVWKAGPELTFSFMHTSTDHHHLSELSRCESE